MGMTIEGGGSRFTGMTIAEAQSVLDGDPTQEELFAALVTLAQTAPAQYEGALSQAAATLTSQVGQQVTEDQVRTVVDELMGASPEGGAEGLTTGPPPPPPAPEEAGSRPGLPPPIGVAPDFTVPVAPPNAAVTGRTIPGGVRTTGRYRAGDEYQWQAKSASEIRRQQRELEKAGLLEPGSYTPGFWDQASANAMSDAMGYANRAGSSWEEILEQLQSLPRQIESREFVAPPELKPDPAAITQRVKAEFRSRLGREPTAEELADYASFLTGRYGAAHDVMVAQARAGFDAETAGMDQEEAIARRQEMLDAGATPSEIRAAGLWDVGIPEESPGSFTGVDPNLDLSERFDRLEGPELGFIEAQQETVRNAQNVWASLRNMSSLIGVR